jgi:hypothetical protein
VLSTIRPSGRARGLTACFLGAVAAAAVPPSARAQNGNFALEVTSEAPLRRGPALISVLHDGAVVAQTELLLGTGASINWRSGGLSPGLYDIRIEAEGLITEAKRGMRILPNQEMKLSFEVRPGKGLHIIEYAIGGLAREEVAMRLMALEASVAALKAPEHITWSAPCCTVTAIDTKTGTVSAVVNTTKRTFVFRPTKFEPIDGVKFLGTLHVGQKVWLDEATKRVSIDGADPCCTIVVP